MIGSFSDEGCGGGGSSLLAISCLRGHAPDRMSCAGSRYPESRTSFPRLLSGAARPHVPLMNEAHPMPGHGAAALPLVRVDAYNAELRDAEGFIGDRASRRAFHSILDEWREKLRDAGDDPLGEKRTEDVGKRRLEKMLLEGDLAEAGLVVSGIEEFAQQLSAVCRKLLRLDSWQQTERIVVGGGFRGSRVGELAIARADVLLKGGGHAVDLSLVRHDPDEAGLIGSAHLVPKGMLAGHDAMLAVDIGGTNIRSGLLDVQPDRKGQLCDAKVMRSTLWRHRDDMPNRQQAVDRLVDMLRDLVAFGAKKDRKLAPFVGIGCPGLIREDGTIERGGQNLPGNWESPRFNLAQEIQEMMPPIDGQTVTVLMHNDAVVQGLSELPWMRDVARWGVLTIGTGLGNARFSNVPS
ncbi:MAG: ROK family protein [Gammaproteobacteria bacterium]